MLARKGTQNRHCGQRVALVETGGEAISELARRGLRSARIPVSRDSFPIFPVSEDAPSLTLDQVNEHRDDS